MNVSDTAAEAAHRVASAVQNGGVGVAVGSSASVGVTLYFGLSIIHWQVIGIAGGLLIGVLGLVGNLFVNAYFQHARLKMERKRWEETR